VLYIVGGAPRAGKSMLAQWMLDEQKMAYFPADILMMGLALAMPELGLNPSDPARTRAPIMWPILRGMAVTILENGEDYLLEGDVLMPTHVVELRERFGSAVMSCFIGYESVDSLAKVRDIRRHASGKKDWTNECDDSHLLRIVGEFKSLSEHLRIECAKYELAYFDGSADLFAAIDQASAYLRDRQTRSRRLTSGRG
jgi:putative acetyltransferase